MASALFGKCHGVSTEAIEYRVRETAASAFWVPMRFQGQYLDDETELLENWNRFYDPPSGKYLEPDPVLAEHPEAIAEAAKRGIQINPYSYAGNNPINVYDPNGKSWVEIAAGVVITVGVLVAVLIIEPCIKKCRAKLEKDHAVCSGESEDNIQKVEALKKKALGQCIDLCVHLGGLAAGGAEPLGMAAEESGEAAGEAASGKEDNGHESQWEQQSAPVPGQ